jgi:hypothetical protein
MGDHQIKFQSLLRELFQFDCADLDFGIYRIMNYKRGVIERFIQEDLPRSISKELAQGVLAEQTQAAQGLEDAKKKIFEIFDDALDATGNLIKYHNTKPGKEYLAALEKAKSTKGHEALEATIYNHLYAFFSRYWQDGDFISKRRYSKRERYAIPYNGEEVTLYWANHDQYYVKTGEHFADYTWKATNGVTVHFKLTAADVEQNNPRIKKVTFSPEWKNGKPKRMATAEEAERSPRIVKVIRLESYEDALNNITFDEPSGQQAMQFEDYLLSYMLQWETRKSETLLNVEKLAKPFSYRLHIHRDGETRAQTVDLPESFAYLLGLYVQKRQVFNDNGRHYLVYRGATREGRKVAVIWRENEGWTANEYKRDKEFVAAQKITEGIDDVYVNGDSYIPGARVLEKLFKERMFAPVEA